LSYGVGRKTLRRLAEWNAAHPGAQVVSVALDFSAPEFTTPDARRSAINSSLSEARQRGGDDADAILSTDQLSEALEELDDLTGIEALVAISSYDTGLLELFRLPSGVERAVNLGTLDLRPLLAVQRGDVWCVLLVNRSKARIFMGTEHQLRELAQLEGDVKNQHKKGGWSQARFERSVGQDVAEHVERAGNEVLGFLRRHDFDHLLIGAPDGLRAEVEGELHSYLAERLRGFVDVDVDNTSQAEVAEAVAPVIAAHRAAADAETVTRFEANRGRGELAAADVQIVLETLAGMRVETLLLSPGFAASGASCSACSYVTADGDTTCPLDGTALQPEADVAAKAVELAFLQSADVRILVDDEPLAPYGGIAAVLRF
jgi:hypothetical protein